MRAEAGEVSRRRRRGADTRVGSAPSSGAPRHLLANGRRGPAPSAAERQPGRSYGGAQRRNGYAWLRLIRARRQGRARFAGRLQRALTPPHGSGLF